MKVVVLGGGGFIGSHLCDLLSSKGHDVNIFDVKKSKYKKILKLKKKFRFTDFELITNYGLFSGDTNLFKTLTKENLRLSNNSL